MPDPNPDQRRSPFWLIVFITAVVLVVISWLTRFPWDYIPLAGQQ